MEAYKATDHQIVPQISFGMLVAATRANPSHKTGTLGICTGIVWHDENWLIYVVPEGRVCVHRFHLDYWEYYRGF